MRTGPAAGLRTRKRQNGMAGTGGTKDGAGSGVCSESRDMASRGTEPSAEKGMVIRMEKPMQYNSTRDNAVQVTAAQASARAIYATNSLTFALDHAGCFIRFNSTGAITCTVPNNSSVSLPVGTEIEICRWGTGAVTIAAESNVTLASVDNARKIDAQYGVVCLKKVSTDIWLLSGCLGA